MIDVYFVVKIKLYVLRIKSDLSQKGLLAPSVILRMRTNLNHFRAK